WSAASRRFLRREMVVKRRVRQIKEKDPRAGEAGSWQWQSALPRGIVISGPLVRGRCRAAMSPNTPTPLSVAEIELPLDPAWFPFATTADVQPLAGLVAQPRAVRALEVGLGIPGTGYNIFAVGLSGTNLPRILQ